MLSTTHTWINITSVGLKFISGQHPVLTQDMKTENLSVFTEFYSSNYTLPLKLFL